MQRINQRQGFIVSAVIHLTLLMILVSADPKVFEPGVVASRLERYRCPAPRKSRSATA